MGHRCRGRLQETPIYSCRCRIMEVGLEMDDGYDGLWLWGVGATLASATFTTVILVSHHHEPRSWEIVLHSWYDLYKGIK